MKESSSTRAQRTITIRTRRKIAEFLGPTKYCGALNDLEFLERLYDLNALRSQDARYKTAREDIWKHCIVNRDWDENWVFSDQRFGFDNGSDDEVLRLLAEILHPDVRDPAEAARLAQDLNSFLSDDGWELVADLTRGRHPLYTSRPQERSSISWVPGFPMNPARFVAALVDLTKHRGTQQHQSVLADSQYAISRASYDNWDGGITGWGVACACAVPTYVQLSDSDRAAAEAALMSSASEILRAYPKHHIDHVLISPSSAPHDNWHVAAVDTAFNPAKSPGAAVTTTERPTRFAYDVALSFAGEDRAHAESLAGLLVSKGVRVFYDRYEQANLWGKDLYQHLQTVYRDRARYCVIFVSAAYSKKLWARHELQQAQARAFTENAEYILPIRVDDTTIPGLNSTVGYLDGRTTDTPTIVDMLLNKLAGST